MTAPLFEIQGADGETLSAYEATNGTGIVLVSSERGRPSHGVKLDAEGMIELARQLCRQALRADSAHVANVFQSTWSKLAREIRGADLEALEERLRATRPRLIASTGDITRTAPERPESPVEPFGQMIPLTTYPADPEAVEAILKGLEDEARRGPDVIPLHPKDYEALKRQVRTDATGRFYLPEGSPESERQLCPLGRHDLVCHCGEQYEGHSLTGNHGPVLMGCAVCHATPDELEAQAGQPADTRPPLCQPGEHLFSCICGEPVDEHHAPHAPTGIGCDLCQRAVSEIEQEQALPYTRPEKP